MHSKNDTSSLRSRLFRAGSWAVGGHFASQVVRLAGNLVLTRLLKPEMFGVVGMATVFLVGLHMFSDLGVRQVVIQSSRVDDARFLNTAWTIQVIRGCTVAFIGILLCGVIYMAAHFDLVPVDSTYARPELPWVLGILSLTVAISGFTSTKTMTTNRSLNIGRTTSIDLISQVIGLIFMLVLAWFWPSVYVLTAGAIVSTIVSLILSHVWLSGINNRPLWDVTTAKEILNFSKWIFFSSIIGFLIVNEDRFILGWLLSATYLGLYSIAALLSGAMRDLVNKVIGMVVFPALGEISRDQPDKIKNLYYKIRLPIDAICLVAMGFLFISGESLVKFLYDYRYADAGKMLEILSLTLFITRYSTVSTLGMALGKPQIMSRFQMLRLAALTVCVPGGYAFCGLDGAIWGVALASMTELPLSLWVQSSLKVLDIKKELFGLLWIPLGIAGGFFLNTLTAHIHFHIR